MARTPSARYPDALKPKQKLGKYVIQDVLGSGGFGITYAAIEEGRPNKRYAIKEFFVREVCSREGSEVVLFGNVKQDDRENYRKALMKFEEEAEILREFSHRSIVRSLDFFEANNTAYIVMEFVKGRDLGSWLSERKSPLRERQVKALFDRVLDAVKYVHDRDFMHRDLSPENIMITRRNDTDVPVIIDFGTMGEGLDRIRSRSLLAYRPEYSPPEQTILRAAQGAFTDIFALGGILYRVIAGRPPADPQSRYLAVINDEEDPYVPAGEAAIDPSLYSADFLEAIDAALEIMPQDRPQDIAELRRMLGWTTSRGRKEPLETKDARGRGEETRVVGKRTRKAKPGAGRGGSGPPPAEPPSRPPPSSGTDDGGGGGTSPMTIVAGLVALALIAGALYLFVIDPRGSRDAGLTAGKETAQEQERKTPRETAESAQQKTPQRTALAFREIHFSGNEISTARVPDYAGCESACLNNTRCAAFSYKAGACISYSTVFTVARDPDARSGVDRDNEPERAFVERRIARLNAEEEGAAREEQRRLEEDRRNREEQRIREETQRREEEQARLEEERRRLEEERHKLEQERQLEEERRRLEEERRLLEERRQREEEERREARRREEEERLRREEEERRRQERNRTRVAEYVNVDFYGDDVDSPPGRVTSSVRECARACVLHGGCRAFTFNHNSRAGARNCFLKGGAGVPTYTNGAHSYFIYKGAREDAPALRVEYDIRHNVDFPFNDLHQNVIRTGNIDQCRAACSNRSDCAGFSYVRGSSQCWLKRALGNARRKGGVTSGVKRAVSSLSPNRILEPSN
ncbi:MAG: hypothetical protein Kow0032_11570 [Methyloligellaceae bacterium]